MKMSWHRTRRWEWAICVPVAILALLFLIAIVGLVFSGVSIEKPDGLLDAFIANAVLNGIVLLTNIIAVAAYACINRDMDSVLTSA